MVSPGRDLLGGHHQTLLRVSAENHRGTSVILRSSAKYTLALKDWVLKMKENSYCANINVFEYEITPHLG